MTTLQDKKIEFKFQDYDDSEKSEHSKQIITTWQDIDKHNRVSHACDSCQLFLNETKQLSIKDTQNIIVIFMAIFNDYSVKGEIDKIDLICKNQLSKLSIGMIPIQYQTIFYQQLVLLFMHHHYYTQALHYAFLGLHCMYKELNQEKKETDQAVEIDLTDKIKTFKKLINQINFKFIYAHLRPFLNQQIDEFHKKIVLLDQETKPGLEKLNEKDYFYADLLPNIVNSTLKYIGIGLIDLGLLAKLNDIYKALKEDFNYHLDQLDGMLTVICSFKEYKKEIQELITFIEILVNHQQCFLARQYCTKITTNLNKREALKEKDDKTERITNLKDTVLKMNDLASEYEQGAIQPPKLECSVDWKQNQMFFKQACDQFYERIDQGRDFIFAQTEFNETISNLLSKLLHEIIDTLGKPPCEFTVVGIKGLSQQTLTPVSAIDVVLLVSDATKRTNTYFQRLIELLRWHCYLLSSALTINYRQIQLSPVCLESIKNHKGVDGIEGYFDRYQLNQASIDQLITYELYRGLPIYNSHEESSLLEAYQAKTVNQSLLQRSSSSYLKADGQLLEKPSKLTLDSLKQAIEKWCVNMGVYFGLKDRAVYELLKVLENQNWFSAAFIVSIKKIYREISCAQLKSLRNPESLPKLSEEALLGKKWVEILNNVIKPIHQINLFLPASFPIDPPVAIYQQMIDQYTNREEWDENEDDDLHEKEKEAKNSQREDNSGRDGKRENNEEGDNEVEQEENIQGTISTLAYNLAIRDGIRAKEYLNYYKLLKDKLQDYREHFRREIEQYRQEIKQSNQDDEHLLRVLKRYPNDDGRRISVEEEQAAWKASYQQLLKPFETEEKPYVKMPDGEKYHLPTNIKIQKLNDAGEYVETELGLFDGQGDLNSSYKNVRRSVARFQYQKNDEIYHFHLKQDPELPVSEYANDRLHEIVLGHGTCKTILCGIKHPRQKKIYPALLSQTVPGVMLSDLLKKHPKSIPELDKKTFHQLVLMALLVNPEDGKPNNYRVESFINEANEAKYRIIGIDNDHAFVPPVLRGNAREYFRLKLFVKCILYCFNELKEPLDQEAREEFLSLNLSKIIDQWRIDVKSIDASYDSIFTETEQEHFIRRSNEERNSYITATFHRGAVTHVYRKLYRMKQLLEDNPMITLIQLLEHLEPELISRFTKNYKTDLFGENQDKTIKQRFEIAKKEYGKEGETITPSNQIVSSQWGYHPTLKELKREYRAQAAFDELFITQGKVENLSKVQQDLQTGKSESFRELLLDSFREKVINMIDFSQLDETQERIIINEMKKTSFINLRLKDCKTLTDKDLATILKKSPGLLRLNISGCEHLTEKVMQSISSQCEQLERLTLNRLTSWTQIITTKTFKHLRKLSISDNPNLVKIELEAPNLQVIQANGSNQLAHKSLLEKYPYLIELLLHDYSRMDELEICLDKTLSENKIDRDLLRFNEERSKEIRAIIFQLIINLFKGRNLVIGNLRKRLRKEGNVAVKAEVLLALAKLGVVLSEQSSKNVVESLVKALEDDNYYVRKNATKALGKLGENLPELSHQHLVETLIKALRDFNLYARVFAIVALGKLGEIIPEKNRQQVVETLIKALGDNNYDVQRSAAKTLGKLGKIISETNRHQVIEALVKELGTRAEDVRLSVAETLGKLGEKLPELRRQHLVETLIKALRDDDYDVQQSIAETLGKLGKFIPETNRQQVIETVVKALEHDDYAVRGDAAKELGKLGEIIPETHQQLVVETLVKALRDSDQYVRQIVAEALGKLGEIILETHRQLVVEALVMALKDDNDWVRKNAAKALGKPGKIFWEPNCQLVVEALVMALKDDNDWVRQNAIEALGKLGERIPGEYRLRVFGALLLALGDKSYSVRACAVNALGKIGDILPKPSRQQVVQTLVKALGDEKWLVRQNAAIALGRLGEIIPETNRQQVVEALVNSLGDENYWVQKNVIEALGKLGEVIPKSNRQLVVETLVKALWDGNEDVQKSAAEMLEKLGGILSVENRLVVVNALLKAVLGDDNSYVRIISASKTLERFCDIPHMFPLLFKQSYEAYLQSSKNQHVAVSSSQPNNLSQNRNSTFNQPSTEVTTITRTTDLNTVKTEGPHP